MDQALEEQCRVTRRQASVFVLEGLGVLMVEGEDRLGWLNGMVTNDVTKLGPGERLEAAIVTVKGKLLAVIDVWNRADRLLVVTERDRVPVLRETLDKLIVMEDVVLADASEQWSVLTIQGPRAGEVVRAAGREGQPADRSGSGGLDLLLPRPERDSAHAALVAAGAQDAPPPALEILRIEAGLPRYGVDMDEDLFPQEARIEDRRVSFQKGCYVGQETVMRLQLRGHPNRLLTSVDFGQGEPPVSGTEVLRDGVGVGHITSATRGLTIGRTVGLALLRREAAAPGTVLQVGGRPAAVAAGPFLGAPV